MYGQVSHDENPFNSEYNLSSSDRAPLTGSNHISNTQALNSQISVPPIWLQDVDSHENSTKLPVNEGGSTNGIDPAVPRMIFYSRVINLLLSVCMIVVSLLSLLTTDNATTGVLACYVVVFSCLICCFETHMKLISKMIALNFGFMYSAKSRSAFMIFVGTILFSFSLFGKIVGCLMLANAAFNIFVLIKFKGYEEAQKIAAQADIQDFLASHSPAFASQMQYVKAGSDFVFQNPELVKAALTSKSSQGSNNV